MSGVENFHADIRAAVRATLSAISGLPAVAWEGRIYTPVKGTPWLSESVRPITSVVMAVGLGGNIAHRVTANFTLHYPPGSGTKDIDAFAGALLKTFRPGTSLVYGSSTAVIQQAERMGVSQDPDWINVPVIITMTGYTSNP